MKKLFAYVLLALSLVAWGAIAVLPLLEISIGTAAALTTALLIGGEISFFVGVTLLGTQAWEKMKSVFKNEVIGAIKGTRMRAKQEPPG